MREMRCGGSGPNRPENSSRGQSGTGEGRPVGGHTDRGSGEVTEQRKGSNADR